MDGVTVYLVFGHNKALHVKDVIAVCSTENIAKIHVEDCYKLDEEDGIATYRYYTIEEMDLVE